MDLDTTLYFHNVRLHYPSQSQFWGEIRRQCGRGGKFYIDIARRFAQSRFVTRDKSEWSLPWPQVIMPGFEMPAYDPAFNKSYEQVTDERALQIRDQIRAGKKFAVMYSGGMDSTLVLASLIKNLSQEEMESVVVCASVHSILENPYFWKKFVYGKIKVVDSVTHFYDDLIRLGYRPITADEGDCIFGTSIGLQLYHNYDFYVSDLSPTVRDNLMKIKNSVSNPNVHYSRYRDILVKHFAYNRTKDGLEFGRLLYEKYAKSAETTDVPVQSLHDFFWWLIFNVKYLNCSVRGSIFFNKTLPPKVAMDNIENWFNGGEYQQWSMVNNNNGEKIRESLATYKYAQRRYIYDVDKNEWYFYFKTKLESLGNLSIKKSIKRDATGEKKSGKLILGLDDQYNVLAMDDESVQNYFDHHLNQYEIDWTE